MTADPDDLRLLRDSVADFCRRGSPLSRARGWRDNGIGWDRGFWRQLAAQGWTGLLQPDEAQGDDGFGLTGLAEVAAGLAGVVAPEPWTAALVLAGRVLAGSKRADLLAALADGRLVPALAWQDEAVPRTLSVEATGTAARTVAGGWRLTGRKHHLRPGTGADGFIIFAACNGGPLLCWAPAGTTGLSSSPQALTDGTWTARLDLDEVFVPHDGLLVEGAAATLLLTRAIDEALVICSVELLALTRRMLKMTTDYLCTRQQFGKPIGSFQALQHMAVDLLIQKELSAALVEHTLQVFDGGLGGEHDPDHSHKHDRDARSVLASRCKARCAEAALLAARQCVQLHGAIGTTDEYDLGLFVQRAHVLSAWLGNPSLHRRRVAALAVEEAPSATPSQGSSNPVAAPRSREADYDTMDNVAFRSMLREFFEREYPAELRFPTTRLHVHQIGGWTAKLSRQGWIAPGWPVEWGGMGLGPEKMIIFFEEQERWGVGRAPDQGVVLVGPLLLQHGSEDQKRLYLPRIISNENIWCQGYSEPNAGSDLASLRCEAMLSHDAEGEHFIVNGQKTWTTLAQDATHIFLLVRTDKSAKKQQGISFLLVDCRSPGIRVRPIRNIAGHEEFCEVFFENVRVPRQALVGPLHGGWTIAKALLGFERVHLGSPKQAQYTLARVKDAASALHLFDDSGFVDRYTKLRLDVADLGTLYSRYVEIVKRGEPLGPDVSMLKVFATDTFSNLADLLVEVGGCAGAMRGDVDLGNAQVDLMTSWFNARPATIYGGSNQIQRNILATQVLRLPS